MSKYIIEISAQAETRLQKKKKKKNQTFAAKSCNSEHV